MDVANGRTIGERRYIYRWIALDLLFQTHRSGEEVPFGVDDCAVADIDPVVVLGIEALGEAKPRR